MDFIKKINTIVKVCGIICSSILIFYLTYSRIKFNLVHLYYFFTLFVQVSVTWEIFLLYIKLLNKKITWAKSLKKRLLIQLFGGTFVVLLVFTVIQFLIYPLDMAIIKDHRLYGYFDYDLIICFLLAIIIQLTYLLLFFIYENRHVISINDKLTNQTFIARLGTRKVIINENEVLCFFSESKLVYAITDKMNSYILDLSLEKIFKLLNGREFFKANRQIILRKSSVKEIVSLPNNRLKVVTTELPEISFPIIISRRNTPSFRKWFNS